MSIKLKYFIKKKIKSLIVKNINNTFFNIFFDFIINNNNFVFCYHEVSDYPSEFQKNFDLFVEEKIFQDQLIFLKKLFKNKKKNRILNQPFLITFDDGYEGSFDRGLKICKKQSIKPIYFLNMHAVNNSNPILSAQIIYLKKYSKSFNEFCKQQLINKPEYLNIKVQQYKNFLTKNEIDLHKIIEFQGKLITKTKLDTYDIASDCFFGNHLYKHYNSLSLSKNEFVELVENNDYYLKKLKNFINIFAFPNGQPKTCFNSKHLNYLKNLNYRVSMSSNGSLYSNDRVVDRIVLTNLEKNEIDIKTKIVTAYFRKISYNRKIKFNF